MSEYCNVYLLISVNAVVPPFICSKQNWFSKPYLGGSLKIGLFFIFKENGIDFKIKMINKK